MIVFLRKKKNDKSRISIGLMNKSQLSNNPAAFYINEEWKPVLNNYRNVLHIKKIQLTEDSPIVFIAKCSNCGSFFYSKQSAMNHICEINLHNNQTALLEYY